MTLRVLLVHTAYRERGGEDAVVDRQAALLRAAGHQVRVHLAENPESTRASIGSLAVAPWNGAAGRRVATVIDEFDPDIVHVHNTWFASSPSVFAAAQASGRPVVATVHNYRPLCVNALLFRQGAVCVDCVGVTPWRGVVRRCYRDSVALSAVSAATSTSLRRALRKVDSIVVPSGTAARLLLEGGFDGDRLTVIAHSVDDPGRRTMPAEDSDRVLFVGRLSPEKGLDALVSSWPAATGLRFDVIGDGPEASRLQAMAAPGVRFLGWLGPADVQAALLSARALVFPSVVVETFGLAVAEALAAGTPALVGSGTAAAELVEPGGGWVVERSSDDWISALSVLADPLEVSRRAFEARNTYETALS
ncbi:MAG: glycosyltransferase family 4 protein, partial [Acidimicrobiia bacterium]|nr:glycosyltransferase family 4 protein [Acidimicrobiia bacterium]